MTTTFVFKNEMILCCHTLTGWLPLQIELPQINDTQKDDENSHNAYQLGRVELLESLTPNHWAAADTLKNHAETPEENSNSPATMAITHHYAMSNSLKLPTITDINGSVDETSYLEINAFISYRQLIGQLPTALAAQLSQAIQLLRWQADTRFCSRCSSPVHHAQLNERAMVCPACQLRQYPRVQPCVITAITRANPKTGEMQILLAHHHHHGRSGPQLQYGLIAGFVEVGESLEHAVVREVAEEVNIALSNIRYVSSQPWPFPSNLMLGFRADYDSGEIMIQESELSHADFFDISNLPKIPFNGSIAYDLIAQIVHEQGLSL